MNFLHSVHSFIKDIELWLYVVIMPPSLAAHALSDDAVWRCLSVWRLSVAYIGPKSRTERPRKTKIGTVAHVTCDSDTTFKVNVKAGQGHQAALLTAALTREAKRSGDRENVLGVRNYWYVASAQRRARRWSAHGRGDRGAGVSGVATRTACLIWHRGIMPARLRLYSALLCFAFIIVQLRLKWLISDYSRLLTVSNYVIERMDGWQASSRRERQLRRQRMF